MFLKCQKVKKKSLKVVSLKNTLLCNVSFEDTLFYDNHLRFLLSPMCMYLIVVTLFQAVFYGPLSIVQLSARL